MILTRTSNYFTVTNYSTNTNKLKLHMIFSHVPKSISSTQLFSYPTTKAATFVVINSKTLQQLQLS